MTLYWWMYVAVKRWCCRVLGHRDGVRISHGYAHIQCQRCWRVTLERLPEVAP